MIILSQLDLRWSKINMSPSTLTLGKAGCTTTCISMLSDYFRCFRSPDQIVANNVKYTNEGRILWQTVAFDKFKFEWRAYGRDDSRINESLKNPQKAVILEINHAHWVVALRRIGPWIQVADPWGGTKHFINQKIVTGSAHFISK